MTTAKELLENPNIDIEEFIKEILIKNYIKWIEEENKRIEQEILYGTGKDKPKGFLNLGKK